MTTDADQREPTEHPEGRLPESLPTLAAPGLAANEPDLAARRPVPVQAGLLPHGPMFHPIPVLRFIIMSLCTFGIYQIYWLYRCWRYVKRRDDSLGIPLLLALFGTIFYYPLLKEIDGEDTSGRRIPFRGLLAISYFLLTPLWRLPDPFWLLTFATCLPLVPAVVKVNRLNASHPTAAGATFRPRHAAAIGLGAPILLFTVSSTINLIPNSGIVPGWMLWNKEIRFLEQQELLQTNEPVRLFYSGAFLSFEDDGNFFTDRRVVSYWSDHFGDFHSEAAFFDEIEDIDATFSKRLWGESEVRILRADGSIFILVLSNQDHADVTFVNRLKQEWIGAKSPRLEV